jgi:hypothetical protein
MLTIRDMIAGDVASIKAAGTSEGAEKGWDARGRGRKAPIQLSKTDMERHKASIRVSLKRAADSSDPSEARMHRQDAKDKQEVLTRIQRGDYVGAHRKLESMDTAPREELYRSWSAVNRGISKTRPGYSGGYGLV